MASEKLCVRWNDFESNFSVAFRDLREAKELFNVTLACDEDQIQAHKVVLAACSPLFRSILQRNPHDHPLLYLKDVKLSNLRLVLDFMYNGEVKVAKEELMSFLAVAGELKVKGLTESNSRPKQESVFDAPPSKPVAPCLPEEQPITRRPPPTSVLQSKVQPIPLPHNDSIQDFVPVKLEPNETPPLEQHQANHPTVQSFNEEDGAENKEQYEDDSQYEGDGFDAQHDREMDGGFDPSLVTCYEDLLKYVVRTEAGYTCPCGRYSPTPSKTAVQYHIESVHFRGHFLWTCSICGKEVKNKRALLGHKRKFHAE